MTGRRPSITAQMKLDVLREHMAMVQCDGCEHFVPVGAVQFDHHLALIDGGTHTVDNLRPLCVTCHRPKSANEHKANCRAKRLAKARQAHDAIVKREAEKVAGSIKSRGFDKALRKRMNGQVEKRT